MSKISRQEFILKASAAAAAFACAPAGAHSLLTNKSQKTMYGLIGKIIAKPGERDALIEILLDGTGDMPGCLSYIISKDAEEETVIWVTEVWDSKESHEASLSLPAVQDAIKKGRPLIAEFGEQTQLEPVGGHGLSTPED